jgi:hypothetical protein
VIEAFADGLPNRDADVIDLARDEEDSVLDGLVFLTASRVLDLARDRSAQLHRTRRGKRLDPDRAVNGASRIDHATHGTASVRPR